MNERTWLDSRAAVVGLSAAVVLGLGALAVVEVAALRRILQAAPVLDMIEEAEEQVRHIEDASHAMRQARRAHSKQPADTHRSEMEGQARRVESALGVLEGLISTEAPFGTARHLQLVRADALVHAQALRRSMTERDRGVVDAAAVLRWDSEDDAAHEALTERLLAVESVFEAVATASVRQMVASAVRAQQLSLALFGMTLLAFAGAVAMSLRQIGRSNAALARLGSSHETLESTVAKRTHELSALLDRHRQLVDLSADPVLHCGPDRTTTYANPAAVALFARTGRAGWQQLPFEWLLAEADRERLAAPLAALWSGEARLAPTLALLARPARVSELAVEVSATPFADGGAVHAMFVLHDISVQVAQRAALEASSRRLSELAANVIAAQEVERRRIARELHDQIGQILTALKLQLGRAMLHEQAPLAALRPALELAEEALHHTRDLTAALHPHVLDNLGLEAATRWLADRYVAPSLPDVRIACRLEPPRADPALELVAFRAIQEGLTNVVRHAEASRVRLELAVHEERLHIDLVDDGVGLDGAGVASPGASIGIASMRERLHDIGGDLRFASGPGGRGAHLNVILPWPRAANDHARPPR